MRYLFFCLFLFYVNVALAQTPFTSVEIEHIYLDSTFNCRALEVNENEYFTATSDGRVMSAKIEGQGLKNLWIVDSINTPHFRSLAVVGKNVFALSIESPALLYKNGEIVYRENDEDAFYDSMEFWNEQEGIAMGDMIDGCISIVMTRDGGNSWQKLPCSALPRGINGEGAFAASDTNIKLLGDHAWIATGGMVSRIYHSADKGITWEVIETPIIQGKATTGIYSIDFYDLQNGFAIGGDYTDPKSNARNKMATKDGGKTWELIAENDVPGYRSCVQYAPQSKGKALVSIGFEGIDVSNDGGQSWTHLSDEGFYTLRFISASEAIAAGKGRVSKLIFK